MAAMNGAQQLRVVTCAATALSLVLAACWHELVFGGAGGVVACVPWALCLCHAALCLLAWRASSGPALRGPRHLLVAYATLQVTQMVVGAVAVLALRGPLILLTNVKQFRTVVSSATALSLALAALWFGFVFVHASARWMWIPWAVWLLHALLCALAWAATYVMLQVLQMSAGVAVVLWLFGIVLLRAAVLPQVLLLAELPPAVLLALFVTSVVMAVQLARPQTADRTPLVVVASPGWSSGDRNFSVPASQMRN
eukprot:m51a1_g1891 hypothetical protein (254) ;mRNA; f:738537-741840